MNAFHYAFKVKDIASTRKFYMGIMGCEEGRSTENWIDFNFFGHQLSAHVSADIPPPDYCGLVDEIRVPIPHFGCIIDSEKFDEIKSKMRENKIEFILTPQKRYEGKKGEQMTMFFLDFSGNAIEFKSYKNDQDIF